MVNLFWEKNMEKSPTGIKFAPKIIFGNGMNIKGIWLKTLNYMTTKLISKQTEVHKGNQLL